MAKRWNTIEISNLNFLRKETDPTRKPTGLTQFAKQIKKGQRIALIGESGSGKSTLLALLRGLHSPIAGSVVKIDGEIAAFEKYRG